MVDRPVAAREQQQPEGRLGDEQGLGQREQMNRGVADLAPAPVRDEPDDTGEQAPCDDDVREIAVSVDHAASLPRSAENLPADLAMLVWSNAAMEFDRHTLVLLMLRPDAPEHTDDEAAALQDRHLAFRAKLRDDGYLIAGGPLVDQDDERLRGVSIMACDPETARRLSNDDPAVQAGRLAVEVMTWMVPAGNVSFEKVRAPRSLAEAAED